MKIKEIRWQNRRDFLARYECENCGYEFTENGYDDRYFHDEVIPNMSCPHCHKTRNDLGIVSEPTPTKYPEGMQL